MRLVVPLIILLLYCSSALGQNNALEFFEKSKNSQLTLNERIKYIDQAILLEKDATQELKYISYKSAIYSNAKDYDKSRVIATQLLGKSQKLKDSIYAAKAQYKLGYYYLKDYILDSSYLYFFKANKLYEQLQDSVGQAKTFNNLGYIHTLNGNYYSAEKMSVKGFELSQHFTQKKISYIPYELSMQLGICSKELNDLEASLFWYNKALRFSRNSLDSSNVYNSLGVREQYKGNHQEAIKNFKKGLSFSGLSATHKLRLESNKIYSEIIENDLSNIDSLESKMYQRLSLKDIAGAYSSAIQLTKISSHKNTGKSIKYAEKAFEYAKRIGSPEARQESLSYLIDLKSNPSLEAKIYKNITDSLQNVRRQRQSTFDKIQFQTKEKEQQLAFQKLATQEQQLLTQKANMRNWLLAIGLLALLISSFFIWRLYKNEAESKKIISEQKAQIEILQREFHHRLKNDFRSISRFIGLVQKKFPDTEFQERLGELKNRVISMFKVHEVLVNEDDITRVKASTFLKDLSNNVETKYREDSISLICKIDENETIVADKAIPFGVVLNEFVTNSYKYAFDKSGGEITIQFNSDDHNHHLTLSDNGKGLPNNFDIENIRSLGLRIIPMFAELHDGSYTLKGDNGVQLTLTLPKKVA